MTNGGALACIYSDKISNFMLMRSQSAGRHRKQPIPPEQRLCIYCNSGKVDDVLFV